MSEITITKENFKEQVLETKEPILVDFWAEWCGPCKMLAPILEELAKEYEGKELTIGKVDIEKDGELANQYHIMNIPTMLLFKNGEVVGQLTGVMTKEELKSKIDLLI